MRQLWILVFALACSVADAQESNAASSSSLDPTITGIIAGVCAVVVLAMVFLLWKVLFASRNVVAAYLMLILSQVCRKEPVPDFAPPPLMIPELKMLFAVSNESASAPQTSGDAKIYIVDAQSIDAARDKYRDWWHGRTEKAPIAVV
jgi:hypothetical protein